MGGVLFIVLYFHLSLHVGCLGENRQIYRLSFEVKMSGPGGFTSKTENGLQLDFKGRNLKL